MAARVNIERNVAGPGIAQINNVNLTTGIPEETRSAFCHRGLEITRIDVLRQIKAWADGEDERHIFWLSGFAGTGKSTIARTVARTWSEGKA